MLRSVKYWMAAVVLTVVATASAWAAGEAAGKWTWKQMGQQGEVTLNMELKVDGEKLTGTITRGERTDEIKEGTIKGTELAFVTIRERNGEQFKTVYKGKVEGDAIKGTIVSNFGGQERTREWVASRVK